MTYTSQTWQAPVMLLSMTSFEEEQKACPRRKCGSVRVKRRASVAAPTRVEGVVNWSMTNSKLKDHFEAADGLSSLHLLSHDPDTDTVMYEERISTPATDSSEEIAMEPKTTTAQLWIGMTDGEAE